MENVVPEPGFGSSLSQWPFSSLPLPFLSSAPLSNALSGM